jgi:hypothetical protein
LIAALVYSLVLVAFQEVAFLVQMEVDRQVEDKLQEILKIR